MIDEDQREILRVLEEGMNALVDAVKNVDESAARQRPSVDSWSVLECVQHLVMTEVALMCRLREAEQSEVSREDRAREAKFQDLAMNRLRRIEAPAPVIPKKVAELPEMPSESLAGALQELHAVRRDTVRFVEHFDGDLRWWQARHPMIFKPVNCYEMLLLIALHPKRHAMQIAEIRSALACVIHKESSPKVSPPHL
jgi:hypothetical protein